MSINPNAREQAKQLLDSEEQKLLTTVLLVMEQLKGRDDWGVQYVYVDSFWRSMAEHGYTKPEIPDPIELLRQKLGAS